MGNLIKDFYNVSWANRKVPIVFDSDAQFNSNVRRAESFLRNALVGLGADPYRIALPHEPTKPKVGLDDFLKPKGGKQAFGKLERVPLFLNHTKTGAEILKHKYPPTTWVVKGLLPSGLTVLSGPPKTGKSWLVLGIVLAIANGGKALGVFKSEPMEALYLALEDSESRLQYRIQQIAEACGGANERAHFACSWESATEADGVDGCLLALERRLDQMPNCKAVFIDTLAKMRKASSGRGDRYQEDYNAVDALKRLADKRGIAVILVHHTRKAQADDFLDRVSGTAGITGAADTIMVLERKRNEATGVLNVTGRDIFEQAMALVFEGCAWVYKGDAVQVRMTETQAELLAVMREEGRPLGVTEIAALTGRKTGSLPKTLSRMLRDNLIVRDDHSKYSPAEQPDPKPCKFVKNQGGEDNSSNGNVG